MGRFRPGPGFLVTAAFIGPGTIVTASRAGAGYGATLLWAVLFAVFATFVLQDMAARVGLAGRRGLAEAIRDSLGSSTAQFIVLALIAATILLGNAAFQTGNLLGAALGLNLITGVSQPVLVLIIGGTAGALLLTGAYQVIQNTLVFLVMLMSVVFCVVAVMTAPSPGELLSGLLIPRVPTGSVLTVMALIGTTVVAYNLFLHASTAMERWPDPSRNEANLRESRRDILASVALGGLITAAVVISASSLMGQEADAAAVATRLEPLLGPAAPVFFGIGLFAAGLTSAVTAPLAGAYAAAGAFGWAPDLKSSRFRALWAFVLLTGMGFGTTLGAPPEQVIVAAQAGNGIVLPLTLVLLLLVVNRKAIVGDARNSRLANVLGLVVVVVIAGFALFNLGRLLGLIG